MSPGNGGGILFPPFSVLDIARKFGRLTRLDSLARRTAFSHAVSLSFIFHFRPTTDDANGEERYRRLITAGRTAADAVE